MKTRACLMSLVIVLFGCVGQGDPVFPSDVELSDVASLDNGIGTPGVGTVGGACFPNGSCNSGAACASGTCVAIPDGALGGHCFANHSCFEPLTCDIAKNLCNQSGNDASGGQDTATTEVAGGDAWTVDVPTTDVQVADSIGADVPAVDVPPVDVQTSDDGLLDTQNIEDVPADVVAVTDIGTVDADVELSDVVDTVTDVLTDVALDTGTAGGGNFVLQFTAPFGVIVKWELEFLTKVQTPGVAWDIDQVVAGPGSNVLNYSTTLGAGVTVVRFSAGMAASSGGTATSWACVGNAGTAQLKGVVEATLDGKPCTVGTWSDPGGAGCSVLLDCSGGGVDVDANGQDGLDATAGDAADDTLTEPVCADGTVPTLDGTCEQSADTGGASVFLYFPVDNSSLSCATYKGHPQNGCDLGVGLGTPVGSPVDGVVQVAFPSDCLDNTTLLPKGGSSPYKSCHNGAGNYVVITTSDGVDVWLEHLKQSTLTKKVGDKVCAGEQIALSGASGNVASTNGGTTGAHLHTAVKQAGVWIYPESLWIDKVKYKLGTASSSCNGGGFCVGKTDGAWCDGATLTQCAGGLPSGAQTCPNGCQTGAGSGLDTCTAPNLCVGVNCLDSNPCTDDSCNPATGCVHAYNSVTCNDGNACTQTDTCQSGTCVGSGALVCNDNNPCTADSCNPASGCTYTNTNTSCDDGNACTQNDYCSGGNCAGTGGPNCDDGNACTTDTCAGGSGCVHTNNSNACNDGNSCTSNDVCAAGSCAGTIGTETCNGADDNCDGVIDNVGSSGLDCFYEVWRAARTTDVNNHRLQTGTTPGVQPAVPADYTWEFSTPVFLVYRQQYGIADLQALYYCCKDFGGGKYDNFYTTNASECSAAGYGSCTSGTLGYVLAPSVTKTSAQYGQWQFAPYAGKPATMQPIARVYDQGAIGHHLFTAYPPEVTTLTTTYNWCCEDAPSGWCDSHYCGTGKVKPIFWGFTPK